MNPARIRIYLVLLLVSLIWGIAQVVIKFTLGGFPPLIFLTYRFTIAAFVALILFVFKGYRFPSDKRVLLISVLYGFLTSTVALGLLFFGTDKTTAIDANLIDAMAPITIAIAGVLVLNEHLTLRERIGVGIAFAGTVVTILEPLIRNGAELSGFIGNLLVFASVLVGTMTAVYAKVLLREGVEALAATNISFIVGFLTTAPIAIFVHKPATILTQIKEAPLPYHLGVIYMAVLSGTLAYYLWHKAEKSIEVGEVGVFAYLYPIFGTPLAVVWLREKITPPFVIGAIIITIGVIIAEFKKRRDRNLRDQPLTTSTYRP